MKICRVETRVVNHPIRPERVVVSHAGRHDESRFVEVTLIDEAGLRGFGEAATVALWSGESCDTAIAVVDGLIRPAIEGATFDHPRELAAAIDRTCIGNAFIRGAVDTAGWDLWAKRQNKSVASIIADRDVVKAIPTRASVGAYDVTKSLEIALTFWRAGIRTLKFKVGMPGVSDADRLRAVRDALGDEPVFTIDANGAYATADDAVRAVEAMAPFNLSVVEQLTPRDRLSMLAAVRKRIDIPMIVDEGVFTPEQLEEAIDLDAFDILSVYPGKNGGFTHSLAMVQRVHGLGKRCVIGSNLETDLGQAAMATLAGAMTAFDVQQYACDLPGVMYYTQPAVTTPLALVDGAVALAAGPGFGVTPVDRQA